MYIQRHAEQTIQKLANMFGAVLVTGPRQVGKTTMLRNMLQNIGYVSLDDVVQLQAAVETPGSFLKDNLPPVFIDEIQKAPELFPQMKLILDESKKKGQYYLTGSQHFQMMKNASESLSGRIGILTLLGLSLRERYGVKNSLPFLGTEEYLTGRKQESISITNEELWNCIWRGSLPELAVNPEYSWQMYYGAYVSTYVERDVRELAQVGDILKFTRFMEVLAARNGQLLNLSEAAGEVGISQPTADRWLSILTTSHIIYLLRPYFNNLTKRAVKTPKLYFLDTGLAAYLSRWNTPEVLQKGAMSGAYFEAFVISEILKSYYNAGILEPPLYFYRDKDKKEIDLLIEENGCIHPFEIKQHSDPKAGDLKNFSVLNKLDSEMIGEGGVICTYDRIVTLQDSFRVIPVGYL
ncbi:MAG: ATP-binding protein [Lachnospiraceae bacterium]|nr:ATP-binding protein [Lachnospiraceae bacterium]